MTYLVRFEVSLLPLDQDNLCHHQGGYQDQHHLHVHRLMTPVFLMEPLMLNSTSYKTHMIQEMHVHDILCLRSSLLFTCKNKNLYIIPLVIKITTFINMFLIFLTAIFLFLVIWQVLHLTAK